MGGTTELIVWGLAGLFVWLLLFPRPEVAFHRFLLFLPFMPSYLATRMVGFGITASRIAMLMLLLAIMLKEPRRIQFRVRLPDFLFLVFMVAFLINTMTQPGLAGGIDNFGVPYGSGVQYGFGKAMDVGVPYLLVRMFVRDVRELSGFFHNLLKPAPLVAVLALVQATTGHNPFSSLKTGSEELGFGTYIESMQRQGFFRADVGLSHFIMLGLFFAMLLPIGHAYYRAVGCTSSQLFKRLSVLILGLVCSVSGGSYMAAGAAMVFVYLWPFRQLWVLILMICVTTLGFIEIASNRHFWVVLASYTATDAASANYRTWAPEIWVEKYLPGHWLFGYGRVKPHMGLASDITNHYFGIIFLSGLAGLIPFLGLVTSCYASLKKAAHRVADFSVPLTRIAWGVAASMTGLLLAMHTVAFFGQMLSYLSVLLAVPASLLDVATNERDRRFA